MGEILSVAGHLAGVIVRKVGLVDLYVGFRTGADVPQEEEDARDGWLDVAAQVMETLPVVLQTIMQARAQVAGADQPAGTTAGAPSSSAGSDGPGLHAVPDEFNDEIKIRWSNSGVGPMATAVYEPLNLRAEGPNLRTVLRDLASQLDAFNAKEGPRARVAPEAPAA
jgi:hypothetical protein